MLTPGLQAEIDQFGAELRERFSAEGVDLEDAKVRAAVLSTFAYLARIYTTTPDLLPLAFLVLNEATGR